MIWGADTVVEQDDEPPPGIHGWRERVRRLVAGRAADTGPAGRADHHALCAVRGGSLVWGAWVVDRV
jgi:hypothetical protein